jgi:effector-binding domain-containing protein
LQSGGKLNFIIALFFYKFAETNKKTMKKIIYAIACVSLAAMTSCAEAEETKTENKEVKDTTTVETVEVVEETVALPAGWEVTNNEEITYLAVMDSITMAEMDQMSAKMGADYGKIVAYMTANEINFAGAPITQWMTWDTLSYSVFAAGIPVAAGTAGTEGIEVMTIPAGQAMKYTHFGSYESMQNAHMEINDYFAATGNDAIGGPWEAYVTDPGTEADTSKWMSEIWYPVAGY